MVAVHFASLVSFAVELFLSPVPCKDSPLERSDSERLILERVKKVHFSGLSYGWRFSPAL